MCETERVQEGCESVRQKGFRKAVEQNDEVIACVGGGVSVPEKLDFVRQKGSRKFLKQKGFRFRQSCRLRRGWGDDLVGYVTFSN